MSEPLELTIWPQWRGYCREGDGSPLANFLAVDAYCRTKRLTDAELAAECWQAHAFHERAVRGQSCIELIMEREVEVWTRFATLPHYDEEES